MTQLLPPKKDVALALLERSNVDVHLDPRAKGVVVPPQFRKEPRLVLKIGLNMPVAIPDLRLDDESMSCTLSFSRSPFYCIVPWPSVFAMVGEDGRGMVWPDDVPQELAERVNDRRPAGPSPAGEVDAASAPSSSKGKGKPRIVMAAAPSPDRPDRAGGRPKRTKKKKGEEQRPVLMAVPSLPREEERDAKKPDAKKSESKKPDEIQLGLEKLGEKKLGEKPQEKQLEESLLGPEKLDEKKLAEKPQDKPEEKTPDERRASISAVPSRAPAASPSPPSLTPVSPAPPRQGAPNRPKRELPPYLRVVK